MHNSDLRLNYSARLGFQPRPMRVQSTKANLHCVKPLRQGFDKDLRLQGGEASAGLVACPVLCITLRAREVYVNVLRYHLIGTWIKLDNPVIVTRLQLDELYCSYS